MGRQGDGCLQLLGGHFAVAVAVDDVEQAAQRCRLTPQRSGQHVLERCNIHVLIDAFLFVVIDFSAQLDFRASRQFRENFAVNTSQSTSCHSDFVLRTHAEYCPN